MHFKSYLKAAVLALACLAPATVRGGQFDAAGVTVDLELPSGYCGLTRVDPVDRLYYEQQDRMQKGHNRIVEYAVQCRDVRRLRSRQAVGEYAIWLLNTPNDQPLVIPPTKPRAEVLAEIAREIPRLDISETNETVRQHANKEGMELTIKDKFAVLDQDDNAVYFGQLVSRQLVGGANAKDVAVVFAVTTISGRLFSLNLYKPYESQATLQELLPAVKEAVANTIAANP